jgi:glycosyltransferase involved in cell wall biosynthesis
MDQKEKISIIIPAYKATLFIKECLDSIQGQTYFSDNGNYEILLGIDGCDETLDMVLKIRNRYKNLKVFMMESNKGVYSKEPRGFIGWLVRPVLFTVKN